MRIKVLKGKLKGHSFEMDSGKLLIGRSPESDLQVPDSSVSRLHAEIFRDGEKYFIRDLKSCNGTWVDGHLVNPDKEVELTQGLRFAVGDALMDLDNLDSGSNTFKYSIDLTSIEERGGMDFYFKDQKIKKIKNLEFICEISEALMGLVDLDSICEKIIDYLFYSLKRISSCAILMVDENSNNIYMWKNKARNNSYKGGVNYSRTIVKQVVAEKKALLIADLENEKKITPTRSMELMGIKSIMCVPLVSKKEIIGVIYAHSADVQNGLQKDDFYMLVALSRFASMAIEKATQHAGKKQENKDAELQRILRHKMEAIKKLSGVVSHEFNNLLMCIQGEASLSLNEIPADDPKYERIKQIEKFVEKGAGLSGLTCGFPIAQQYLKKCSDLNGIVDKSVKEMGNLPGDTFQMEPASDLWKVNIDEKQILGAIIKIYFFFMSNAKHGVIKVKTENRVLDSRARELTGFKKGRYVKITITDNARHLKNHELLEIFSPGINLEKGMGPNISSRLTSAYWTIEKNMGRLVVTSSKENGIDFSIYLPAVM